MAGKYLQQIIDARTRADEWQPQCCVINYQTAADIVYEADAEIASLREKCDKLAGQLLKVNAERTEPDKLYIITGRREFKEAVQIAQEVKG